jgi:tetratricopeptide (TPR) repeat protein
MIGFTCKSSLPAAALAVAATVFLAGCAGLMPQTGKAPAVTVPEQGVPAEPAEQLPGLAEKDIEPPVQPLTSSLLYDVLLGEIAGQRGRLDVSGTSYLEAARESQDPRIAERALKIAVFAKQQDTALAAARRWVELAPDDLEARQALAALALRSGDTKEALQQFEYLLSRHPEQSAELYQSMLGLLAREPETEKALELMEQFVALRPDDADAHFSYARLALHVENLSLAEAQVEKCLQLRPGWTQALVLRAQINLKQERGELAQQQLRAAVQQQPGNDELRLALARLLVDVDDFEGAREQYRILLEHNPDSGQVVYSLALLALEAGQLDEARESLERLITLDYQTQQAYYYLGAIAEEQGKHKRAMQWYRKVEEGEHWIEVQIRMARLEAVDDDIDAARERLRRLRLSQPEQAQRLFLVEGEILAQVDRHDEAYALYSNYLEINPQDEEILYARALIAEHLGLLDQAETDLLTLLEQDPDNTRALNALGYTLADRTDRYQEALAYIEKALQQTPDDPAVIDSMGWVLYRLGRLQEAREYLQRAYDMTADGEIAAHLGEVMWAMGDYAAARALWKQAREDHPDDEVLQETIERLAPQ